MFVSNVTLSFRCHSRHSLEQRLRERLARRLFVSPPHCFPRRCAKVYNLSQNVQYLVKHASRQPFDRCFGDLRSEQRAIDRENYFILTTDDDTLSLNCCLNYRVALLYFSVAIAQSTPLKSFN